MQYYEHGGNTKARLDFSVNTNPLGCPVDLAKFDLQALSEHYPDPKCIGLRNALAEKWGISTGNILCGNGASDLIMRICAALRPRKAFTLTPTFSEYERCVKLYGGEIADKDYDIAFICNPNNPTGQTVSEDYIRSFLDKGVAVVLDECFIEFTESPSMVALTNEYPNLLILNAFTKIYAMAGLRLGYLICSNSALLSKIAGHGTAWSVSGIAQAIGISALGVPNFIEKTKEAVKMEREYMMAKLTESGLEAMPSKANFMIIKSRLPLCKPLLAKGISVRGCSNFQTLDEHYIRIGLKLREPNNELLAAINEVLNG
jgi:threonine-phosphate decarboxylase